MSKSYKLLLISILLFFYYSNTNAQKQAFDYLDVFDLQYVADPQISPDGETIIYVRHQFDIMTDRRYTNLWQISFNGENHQALTSGKSSYGTPAWSPDGSKIAYTSSEEGSNQIYIRWMDSGETSSITNLTNSPGSVQWSPDGDKLLFTMNIDADKPSIASYPGAPEGADWAPGAKVIEHVQYRSDGTLGFIDEAYRHIFVVSADGGAPRQLTEGDFNHSSPTWTPEGNSILFTADYSGNEALDRTMAQIFEMDIETGEKTQLTDKRGPHNSPIISPDGDYIAFTGFEDEFIGYQLDQLYLMNRDGTDQRVISDDIDRDISSIQWANNSQSIFFLFDDEGISKVGNMQLTGDYVTVASDLGSSSIGRPYGGGSYSVAENGRFAIPHGSTDRPAELAVGDFSSESAAQQITNINNELTKARSFGETREFWVDSSVDDFRTHGWIITPPDFNPDEKYPMILEIHGGPYANYGPRFTPELQLMASKGYVVVYTNPRGSTSYGEDFGAYINHNYPSEDYNDLMDAVDYVVDQGYVDENKLFITGGSGGGVLSAWSVGKTDRFAAAVVAKPVINWFSFALTADNYPFYSQYWFNEHPWDDPMQYFNRSPISLVGNVNTPTMLLTGESDFRTPMSESEQFYNALKKQGVEASLVRIPDSPHTIVTRPSNLIRKASYIIGWFDRYQ